MNTQEKELSREEKRVFSYKNSIGFEFEIDVSDPETSIAEITDFLALLDQAKEDMIKLRQEQTDLIEKPKKGKAEKNSPKKSKKD